MEECQESRSKCEVELVGIKEVRRKDAKLGDVVECMRNNARCEGELEGVRKTQCADSRTCKEVLLEERDAHLAHLGYSKNKSAMEMNSLKDRYIKDAKVTTDVLIVEKWKKAMAEVTNMERKVKFYKIIGKSSVKMKSGFNATVERILRLLYDPYVLPVNHQKRIKPLVAHAGITQETNDFFPISCLKNETNKDITKLWEKQDPLHCKIDDTPISPKLAHFRMTRTGQDTGDFINHVLKMTWGPNPPRIDLYIRTGCHAYKELRLFVESAELFWPRFLGDIVIVLDVGNESSLDKMLPRADQVKHSYRVVYEAVPRMPGRLLNQYSYLNLDRYSKDADFVVTTDVDTIFFTPVFPDILFNDKAKLKVLFSRSFQNNGRYWEDAQYWFTKILLTPKIGHTMITQPVAFTSDTFAEYRNWVKQAPRNVKCYESRLGELSLTKEFNLTAIQPVSGSGFYPWGNLPVWLGYCWMCQLGVYLKSNAQAAQAYDLHTGDDVELGEEPYVRYAAHVTYEAEGLSYVDATSKAVQEGLCFWFGTSVFEDCFEYDVPDDRGLAVFPKYWYKLTSQYAAFHFDVQLSDEYIKTRLIWMRERFGFAIQAALAASE